MSEPVQRTAGPAWAGPAVDCALVWPFAKAPAVFQGMSEHFGDEDWVAYVPAGVEGFEPEWPADWIRGLGVCSVHYHRLTDGALVYIGAHA